MERPVILIWGIGPTYRRRIIHNIQKAINTGYGLTMDYIVLTDHVDDFYSLPREIQNKIISVVDINRLREPWPWSSEEEMVPKGISEEEYANNYLAGARNSKMFSYGLHRFSLLEAGRLGINRFVLQDNDVDIRYDKIVSGKISEDDFWGQFDTPINSMKGCHKETIFTDNTGALMVSNAIGHNSHEAFNVSRIIFDSLNSKYGLNKNGDPDFFEVTEGPFRYYNFPSSYDVIKYFDVWNHAIMMVYQHEYIKKNMGGGGYMLCDFIPVGIANRYMGLQVLDFPNEYFTTNIYYADRYFMPRGTHFTDKLYFKPALTVKEFYEVNADLINWFKGRNDWRE